jgi:hypothetical protein
MYRKDMESYKEKILGLKKEINIDKLYKKLEDIIQEIYEHGYEDGINEKEHEQEKEPVPWEDLD